MFRETNGTGEPGFHRPIQPMVALLAAAGLELLYLMAVYFFLTSDDAFNFNNNYHLIAFSTLWISFCNLGIFFVLSNQWAGWEACMRRGDTRIMDDGFFVSAVSLSALAALPVSIYFYILDDFVFQPRQVVAAGLALALLIYAFRRTWRGLLTLRGLVTRILFLAAAVLFIIAVMEILNGLIPTAVHGQSGDIMLPL